MYQARYYKTDGSKGSEVSLPTALFDGVVNENVLHQVVKAYLANQRAGTGSAKSRGEVRGGSRKPWRQKGTGRARAGTTRASHWAGGGVAFPPKPHSWRQKVPKKVRALARRSAFNDRAESGRIVVIEGFQAEAPKTKWLMGLLSAMETEGKVLLLTDGVKENVHLSGRNLPDVNVIPFGSESPYDVVWSGTVVIEEAALRTVPKDKAARKSGGRRPFDPEALAAEASATEARQKARNNRPDSTRRVRGDEIDLSAPELVKEARAPKAVKAAPVKKVKKPKKEKAPRAKAPKTEVKAEAPVVAEAPAVEAPVEEAPAAAAPAAEPAAPKAKQPEAKQPEAKKPEPQKSEAKKPEAKKPEPKTSGFDAAAVELPRVADLAEFLAGFDSAEDVKALSKRDTRKTAVPLYAARIEEIEG